MPVVNYDWDELEDNIVEEYDDAGATIADYTTEPDHFGNVISQHRSGQSSVFHYDGLGSTLAVTDDNQNVTDTFAYTAFGEVTERTGTTEVPFQYIGQKGYYTDSLTGEIMARRRPYEPVRARWLSVDQVPQPTLDTAYTYADNSPLLLIDPSGRISILFATTACADQCYEAKCDATLHTPIPRLRKADPFEGYVFAGACPDERTLLIEIDQVFAFIRSRLVLIFCKDVTQEQIDERMKESMRPTPKCPEGKVCTNLKPKGATLVLKDNESFGDIEISFYYKLALLEIELSDKPLTPGQMPCKVTVKGVFATTGVTTLYGDCKEGAA